jgi:hypothetical protein
MNEPILFGLAIITLLITWHSIVRKTALDHFRDKLFDLREKARNYYLENGYGLEHKTYTELRNLLNAQIRFLESVSPTRLIIYGIGIEQNKELHKRIHEDLEKRFQTGSEKLAAFIKQTRQEAYHHTTGYILHSSIAASLIVYTLLPALLSGAIIRHSFKLSKKIIGEAVMKIPQKAVSIDIIEGVSKLKLG